ncbi:hypothetical protein ACIQCR_20740 [Streptomyces sp. NPDC093249]|uniref:hypothetical protein n=1 Tax=unclassified Streptomyces TaxID=2593676 RepID=UPI00344F4106
MSVTLRRRTAVGVISLALAVPLGLAAPATAGAAERPATVTAAQIQVDPHAYNGRRLEDALGVMGIWVVIDGKRWGIPDMQTYDNLFYNANTLKVVDLESIPFGGQLSHDAHLVKSPTTGARWLLSNGQRRYIMTSAFTAFQFDANKVQPLRDVVLNSIPMGSVIDI